MIGENGSAGGTPARAPSYAPDKPCGTEDDAKFVASVIEDLATREWSPSERVHPNMFAATSEFAPEGDGWVHLSILAPHLDGEAAVKSGRAKDWRHNVRGKYLREMLAHEPFASHVEHCAVPRGKHSKNSEPWVRLKAAAQEPSGAAAGSA